MYFGFKQVGKKQTKKKSDCSVFKQVNEHILVFQLEWLCLINRQSNLTKQMSVFLNVCLFSGFHEIAALNKISTLYCFKVRGINTKL